MTIQIGDIVGDYRVIDLAGSGGMGAVYKIEHVITKRIEAMKVLCVDITSGPEDEQRFEREIQVQARLHHPHIAALYNAVRGSRSIALIMEYVEGESLQRMLERGPLPLGTAVDYACQILDALAYAHDQGVVHRDVSPANILITSEGVAKLTDFGLALGATDLRLSTAGMAVGSPWYMSPEQVRAVDEVDARTDIYALGAVLHEMATGRKLFDADGSFAVMRAQTEEVPRPPSACNPEIPAALDEMVAKALAKDPADRFQSAGEFRLALEAAAGEMRDSSAAPGGWSEEIARQRARQPGPLAPPLKARGAARWRRRFRPRSLVFSGLLTVAAAVAAIVCAGLLRPGASRVEIKTGKVAALPTPVPVTAAAPTGPEAPGAEAAVQPDAPPAPEILPAPRSTASPAPHKPQAGKVDRSLSETRFSETRGKGAEPAAAPPPNLPPSTPAAAPAHAQPELAAGPGAPPGPVAPELSTEPEPPAQTAVEPSPPKAGNRFVRALRRLNPFRKDAKSDPADAAKAATKKD